MEVNFNSIDEIGVFHKDDGSYSVELYMSTITGERITVKMPRSSLDMNWTSSYEGMSIELKLEGAVSSI
jgi:hypothetical protein